MDLHGADSEVVVCVNVCLRVCVLHSQASRAAQWGTAPCTDLTGSPNAFTDKNKKINAPGSVLSRLTLKGEYHQSSAFTCYFHTINYNYTPSVGKCQYCRASSPKCNTTEMYILKYFEGHCACAWTQLQIQEVWLCPGDYSLNSQSNSYWQKVFISIVGYAVYTHW